MKTNIRCAFLFAAVTALGFSQTAPVRLLMSLDQTRKAPGRILYVRVNLENVSEKRVLIPKHFFSAGGLIPHVSVKFRSENGAVEYGGTAEAFPTKLPLKRGDLLELLPNTNYGRTIAVIRPNSGCYFVSAHYQGWTELESRQIADKGKAAVLTGNLSSDEVRVCF